MGCHLKTNKLYGAHVFELIRCFGLSFGEEVTPNRDCIFQDRTNDSSIELKELCVGNPCTLKLFKKIRSLRCLCVSWCASGFCGTVPGLQSEGCRFDSRPGLLRTKVYSAFHPPGSVNECKG